MLTDGKHALMTQQRQTAAESAQEIDTYRFWIDDFARCRTCGRCVALKYARRDGWTSLIPDEATRSDVALCIPATCWMCDREARAAQTTIAPIEIDLSGTWTLPQAEAVMQLLKQDGKIAYVMVDVTTMHMPIKRYLITKSDVGMDWGTKPDYVTFYGAIL